MKGLDDAGSPPFLGAVAPEVIIVNNGPRTGRSQTDDRAKPIPDLCRRPPMNEISYLRMAKLPGLAAPVEAEIERLRSLSGAMLRRRWQASRRGAR
jgi:hypothetical protein